MREKDEWRFATMEYGGQCVTMAGMKWMQVWSVLSSDMDEKVRRVCYYHKLSIIPVSFSHSIKAIWRRRWTNAVE